MSLGDFTFSILTEQDRRLPFYLVGAGMNFHQELDPHTRPSGYPHYQLIQVIRGKGIFTLSGRTFEVEKNRGILLFPDVAHEYHAGESPWIVNWFTFNGNVVRDFLNEVHIAESGVYDMAETDLFPSIIQRSLDLLKTASPTLALEGSLLVYEFLVQFSLFAVKDGEGVSQRSFGRINTVIKYIDKHFSDPLTIDIMADVIGVTPQYLCKLFRSIVKQRPVEYLNNVRINKSKKFLLLNPYIRIDDVSRMSGYESPSYFCSIFRKTEGMSPGQFRELHLHKKYLV